MSRSPLYFLRVEGQNFRWVIDDTHNLSTIAGGSRMLASVPDRVESRLKQLTRSGAIRAFRTIQRAASIGLFAICPGSEQMPSILGQIRHALGTFNFRHLTVSVEAVGAGTIELTRGDKETFVIPDEGLQKIDATLERQLIAAARFAQMRAPTVSVPEIVPGVNNACCEDHVRPAERNGDSQRSASVLARIPLGRYFRWTSGSGGIIDTGTVYDFNQMTSYPGNVRWAGKLAAISIDGKGFTKLRNALCTTAADLGEFSGMLQKKLNGFHLALMERWTKGEPTSRYMFDFKPKDEAEARKRKPGQLLRFQRLVSAGDDAVYLMPAWLSWEFLTVFFGHDWKWNWEAQPGKEISQVKKDAIKALNTTGLTFRAGVVICHAKAPIHPVRNLAHRLEAEVAAEDGKHLVNPVAYEVLKSYDFIGSGLAEYRERKRSGLEAQDSLLDGGSIRGLKKRLECIKENASSGEIKNPARWPGTLARLKENTALPKDCGQFQLGDLYHMSQWRDYIF